MGLRLLPSGEELSLKALSFNALFCKAGIRENANDNRSEQIDIIEREWGLLGEPYCAMGECHVEGKALCVLSDRSADIATINSVIHGDLREHYFVPSPSCQEMVDNAKARKLWHAGTSGARPGDLIFFNWEKPRGNHASHVGMVVSLNPDGSVNTIEWNTMPGPSGNQSDGGGVYKRTRPVSCVVGYLSIYGLRP